MPALFAELASRASYYELVGTTRMVTYGGYWRHGRRSYGAERMPGLVTMAKMEEGIRRELLQFEREKEARRNPEEDAPQICEEEVGAQRRSGKNKVEEERRIHARRLSGNVRNSTADVRPEEHRPHIA